MRQEDMDAGNKILLDIIGYTDAKECAGGKASGCVWTVIGLIPVNKIKAAGKFAKALLATARTGCRASSFVPGTLVQLADGTTKPIEDVVVGDIVLATDPETGTTGPKEVTATTIGAGTKVLIDITVDTDGDAGNAVATLTATGTHPFWSPDTGAWVEAADLQPRQWLLTETGGRAQVHSLVTTTRVATVHNFTVTDVATYYVLAGRTPVLVHNTGPCFLSDDAFKHIWDGHRYGGAYHQAGEVGNVFRQGMTKTQLRWMIQKAMDHGTPVPRVPNDPRSGYYKDFDFGDMRVGANGQNGLRVVFDGSGNVLTAHPIYIY